MRPFDRNRSTAPDRNPSIHRASAQSGGGGNPPGAEESREYAKQVIAELGVKDIAALQKMDWAKLNEVSNAVAAKMNPPAGPGGPTRRRARPNRGSVRDQPSTAA